MVRYERFGLGETWNDEYGTAADPAELGWLLGYSPYHHVRAGTAYPAVLFTVFDGDTRVDPLHASKMCAALQFATTVPLSERPVLLRREARCRARAAVGQPQRARWPATSWRSAPGTRGWRCRLGWAGALGTGVDQDDPAADGDFVFAGPAAIVRSRVVAACCDLSGFAGRAPAPGNDTDYGQHAPLA